MKDKLFEKLKQSDCFKVGSIFLISRIVILILGFVGASSFINSITLTKPSDNILPLEKIWYQWDVKWYEKIALNGYEKTNPNEDIQTTWGFMPLYPVTIGVLMRIFHTDNFFLVGMIASNIFTFLALLIIYKFIKEKTKSPLIFLVMYCFSAGAFYLFIPYSESIYLLIIATVFYLGDQYKYIWASILAGLSVISRIQGLALVLIAAFPTLSIKENYIKKFLKFLLIVILFSLPVIIFTSYIKQNTGDPLEFIDIQKAWNNPGPYPFKSIIGIFTQPLNTVILVHIYVWFMYLFILFKNYKKIELHQLLYCLGIFAISTSTEVFYGAARYVLALIPIYLLICEEKNWIKYVFFSSNLILLTIYIIAFVTTNSFPV